MSPHPGLASRGPLPPQRSNSCESNLMGVSAASPTRGRPESGRTHLGYLKT